MTPNELDQILRTLSEHEKGYRDGVCPTETRPFVNIGGVSILKSSFWDNVGAAGTESAPLIRFKQHSRFREYPLHTHDFVELAYMYDGMCVETLNDRILGLRKALGLYVNLRPVKIQDSMIEYSPLKPEIAKGTDIMTGKLDGEAAKAVKAADAGLTSAGVSVPYANTQWGLER